MKKLLLGLSLALAVTSCSSMTNEQYSSLGNKGILPLSTTNAYLGSNLFLSDEFSKSSDLFNFLHMRGAPAAIEVESKQFGDPHLIMYYPQEKEVYMADLHASSERYQWVVRGPFQIEHKDYRELGRALRSYIGEPQFNYHGQSFRFRPTAEELAKLNTPTPAPTLVPTRKPLKKSQVITAVGTPSGTPTPRADEPFKPLNSDQQAIAMSNGFAERATNGDVIHTVTSESETFESIAKWYTGSEANYKEIASLNGFTEGAKPKAGSRIDIPLKMVKQFKAMRN